MNNSDTGMRRYHGLPDLNLLNSGFESPRIIKPDQKKGLDFNPSALEMKSIFDKRRASGLE